MFYKDQYAALSSNNPDCARDGEPEEYPLTEDGSQPTPPIRYGHRRRYPWVVLAVLAQVVYTVLVLVAAREFYYKRVCAAIAAPDLYGAWSVLEYREVPGDHQEPDENHPFLGTPSPSLDRHWHELLSTFRDRLSSKEVKRLGIEEGSIWLDDDIGEYYGSVWVGHNLHCVLPQKYLYDGLHRDHYYPNLTASEESSHQRHLHHCLHRLMDALKCQPDMSPLSQHWVVNEVVPVVNWDGARHTCANWDKVLEWAKNNRIVPAGKASIPEVAPHPLYAKFIDEHGKADFVNKDAIIEWDLLWARPDWQEFAREHGIPQGTIPPKEMLRNKHVG
ncbi:hypothetical protein PpBr36_04260 [Pyricularia pennisetigena]|uniref:hypothetical protein n=1 Tax=Pyricularia pennisetigena TaxID=1578925 RepID=UPI00114FAD14|nr:hypothetical protein PpBr36_04260 [Pyricularia pennisetigena]TLS26491.1 hypothetical protein PpBr36_04260 [Pyricularia pennisetigena]